MRKRLFSILLALCMALCLVPTTAFAESETEETPVCTCETACTAEAMNADCPICGVEGALAENCGKYAAEESGQTGAPDNAPAIIAADVQALINALPEFETISADNAVDVEAQLEAIDEAKVQLSDEDFAVLDFTRYDAAATVLMALSGEPGATFVPQAASSHTHCICGGENTVGDHTAHQAADYQPWNGSDAIGYTDGKAYVYLTDNATINSNLVVDGATLYLCLNGKEYASNGTNKIQVKNGGRLVLCDCQGGGTIKCATNGWGGMGIYIYTGTVDVFGGKLTGGKVNGNGGGGAIALEDNSSTLNIYGGEISGNNGNGKGGAIYAKSGGTINMYGGRIAQNEAYRGGGLCLAGGTFNMYGGLLENNSSTANWDTIPANSGNLYIADKAVMNANAGVVRGGGYAVFNLGTIQTDDANYPATIFYSGLYNMGGVVKGGMYYGSYMSAGGNLGGCEVHYTLADSNHAKYHYAWQFIEPGNTPTRPGDPTKTGYLFDGWYVGENTFDFSVPVTESVRVVAKWSECDHTGSTAQPTCTDSAVCTVCGGTIPATGHTLVWHNENGQYWQTCSNCSFTSEKKAVPEVILNAPDTVCQTQDCAFTFNLPEGCTNPEYGYEFVSMASGDSATVENGVCSGVIEAAWYAPDETSFVLTAYVTTADGFTVTASKTVKISEEHVYEWQSENGEYWQKCKLCGNETTKKLIPEIVISGADRVCRTQDYTFGFTLPEGCKLITTGYEFEKIGGDLSATLENGNYTVELASSGYPVEENSFKVMVHAETADGFAIKAEKTVTIQNDHTGGKATCKDKAKCEVCGAEYGEIDAKNHTDLKHIPAKVATKTAEGNIEYWYCDGCKKYFSDAAATKEITKAATVTAKRSPQITAGDGAAVTQGEKKELTFTSDASFADFLRVELDGTTLDERNYTKKEGSTIITLNRDFVATLSVGEHTLAIVSQHGTATAKFTVKAKPAETAPPQPTAQPTQTAQPVSPILRTGDTANPTLWFALLIVSGGAAIGITVASRKKKHNK